MSKLNEKMDFDNNISFDYINRFLYDKADPLYPEIEEYAKAHGVPIASREVGWLLRVLVAIKQPRDVLEIGTAIGYSARILGEYGARVVSIERDSKLIEVARRNCDAELITGDALEVLPTIRGEFDLVFMDACKGHYIDFFPHCMRVLRPGGVIISDNVLYRGMIATDDLRERRKITIIKRLRKYIDEITTREDLMTTILPIGDGVSISVKKLG